MGGLSIAEKILSRAAGRQVSAGDLVICEPDMAMGTDGSVPMALEYLANMCDGDSLAPKHADRLLFALDHYGPSSGASAQALQQRVRDYATDHGVRLYEVGEGIGHQIVLESTAARPGLLVVGADSHSTTYGAVNAFATGIGSSDFAGVMRSGQLWLKVPETIRIILTGALAPGVAAKDVALHMARLLGADGATYKALEFCGPGVLYLSMDDRIVLSNMSVEIGAKAGIFACDDVTRAWLKARGCTQYQPVEADGTARYIDTLTISLNDIAPLVALPHRVDSVIDLTDAPATRIDVVYLGTCTGGRVQDFQESLDVLHSKGGVAPGVRLVVTPASAIVEAEMQTNGMLAAFKQLGAEIQAPGCGSCCGTCGMVPGDGVNVVSTANRNFKGRMGNAEAAIYLASPRSCAEIATTGRLNSGVTK